MSKYTSFSVHNVYSSHMVLQRNKPILIAGTGVPQARVSGKFDDLQVEAIVKKDGEWVLEFPPCKEGGPHTITVTSNTGNTYTFEDILIGDGEPRIFEHLLSDRAALLGVSIVHFKNSLGRRLAVRLVKIA